MEKLKSEYEYYCINYYLVVKCAALLVVTGDISNRS